MSEQSSAHQSTLREILLSDFNLDLPLAGGFGGSKDDPIIILPEARPDYVAVEYAILRCIGIVRRVEWKLKRQTLLHYKGKTLDQMKIETIETTEAEIITSTVNYYFDVSACMNHEASAESQGENEVDSTVRENGVEPPEENAKVTEAARQAAKNLLTGR